MEKKLKLIYQMDVITVKENVINDLVYYNNLKIIQNKNYFNFSLDSILLANFVKINFATKNILDLYTGNAPIPLVLSTKTKANIIGVEIQKEIFDLAADTIKINKLEQEINIINDHVKNLYKIYNSDTFDIITCNPPYFKKNDSSILNKNNVKSVARHEILLKLNDIMLLSRKLLKNGGNLVLIHRTDRLIEIIESMKKNNIEPKRIRFIYPKLNTESNLVLIEGRKNGKVGLKLLSPLYVHNSDNSYTEEVL